MVTVRLLVGAVLGLCATAGASPTYCAPQSAAPDNPSVDDLLSDASPVLTSVDAAGAGSFLVQNALDLPLYHLDSTTLILTADPDAYRPAASSIDAQSSLNALNNADAETISTLINAPDATRRNWFSEAAPGIAKLGFTNANALADARGLLQAAPTIAVIPLPGALVSGATTIGLIGLAYAAQRLRRR